MAITKCDTYFSVYNKFVGMNKAERVKRLSSIVTN